MSHLDWLSGGKWENSLLLGLDTKHHGAKRGARSAHVPELGGPGRLQGDDAGLRAPANEDDAQVNGAAPTGATTERGADDEMVDQSATRAYASGGAHASTWTTRSAEEDATDQYAAGAQDAYAVDGSNARGGHRGQSGDEGARVPASVPNAAEARNDDPKESTEDETNHNNLQYQSAKRGPRLSRCPPHHYHARRWPRLSRSPPHEGERAL
jgi:hypothetical protein